MIHSQGVHDQTLVVLDYDNLVVGSRNNLPLIRVEVFILKCC
jgi:hypothetical protein